MKELNTLIEELAVVTDAEIQEILGDNPNIDVTTLTTREKLSMLIFREQAAAINNADRTLVLDANYAKSKFHNKTDKELAKGQCNQWLVDYYRLLDADGNCLVHIRVHASPAQGTVKFGLRTSCAESVRMQFELENDLGYYIKRRPNGAPRRSNRDDVGYGELADLLTRTMAVLAAGEKMKEDAKAEKQKAKAEAKANKAEAKKEPEITVEPEKTTTKRKRPVKKVQKAS